LSEKRFHNHVVLITGAASGIGAATAERMGAEGATLFLADLDADGLERIACTLRRDSAADVAVHVVDVADDAHVREMVATCIATFGQLHVLVNNAGISMGGNILELTTEQWRRVMSIDADSVFFASKAALPHLIASSGSIVNTCSISGVRADYGLAGYNAAKGAVANLTRAMAIDHAVDGVRVNSVCPGGVATPMLHGVIARFAEEYEKLIPMGRPAEPHEIAAAITFLASTDASYITGHNLVVDGGVTAATGQPNFARLFADRRAARAAKDG
jgi:meso-butanediol dehydrogenase/(S,S)-butanediol dehydrogenase/diacetyl reductase